MVGYIYKIINKVDGRFYIGSTINFEKRKHRHLYELNNNRHHNIFLQRAFEKYGIDSFEFFVKEKNVNDAKELQILEERYINFCWNSGILYNISKKASGGDLISYHPKNDDFRKLQSKLAKERYTNMSIEEKEKLSENMKGEKNPNFGNRWNDEQRLKASKKMKEKIMRGDYNSINCMKGKTFEEIYGEEKAKEIKKKLSVSSSKRIGEKNSFYGKHHSEESKKKMSEKRKGIKPVTRKKVLYNGIVYESASDCAIDNDINYMTVCYRARNNIYGFSFIDENNNQEQRKAKPRWNKEMCEEIAKTCKTKKEFFEKSSGAFTHAKDKGYLKEFSEKYFIELRHYWSFEEIIEICKKYKTYCDFRENEKKVYSALCRHKDWKEEIKKYFNDIMLWRIN